jgi:bifunctional oligoribonuclease and PAP phosphatase NrnA
MLNNKAVVKELTKYTKELSKLFSRSENILLICHINPDGDAIGAQLALYYYLRQTGRNVNMLSPNNLQMFLKWMEGTEHINIFIANRKAGVNLIRSADLIIMLDFNQMNRLGEAEEFVVSSSASKVIIDHHLNPPDFDGLLISDSSYCATSEIIHVLISELHGEALNSNPYAEAIYTGIITDTGNFEHGNYTSRTLRIIADLIDMGVRKEKILDLVYNNFSAERMKLQGFALYQRMIVLPEYNTAYISLSMNDLKEFNHVKGDTEGFVNLPLSIKGVIFTALFIEKEGFVKLSFRSKGNFPTNEFASRYFSGGGHMNASGGEYYDTLENSIKYFLDILKENYPVNMENI